MIRILIVDDHAIVGGGLKQFLNNIGEFEVAGQASSGMEALSMLKIKRWDLLMLDIGLPDINGLEVLRRVKRDQPELPVLVFSMYSEDEYAMMALDAGAIGYLQKDSNPEEILVAIRRASSGRRYLSPMLADKLLSGKMSLPKKQPHDSLSVREFDVMQMLSQGVTITEIAERLFLSPKTVSTYRARVMEKLDLRHNADITRYVLENKLGQ